MRYLFLMLVLCAACNTVKKSETLLSQSSQLHHEILFDSDAVYRDYLQLNQDRIDIRSESYQFDFEPGYEAYLNQIKVIDTGDITVFDFGKLPPTGMTYSKQDSKRKTKDSSTGRTASVKVTRSEVQKEKASTEIIHKTKASSRVPWYFLLITAVFLFAAAYSYRRMLK